MDNQALIKDDIINKIQVLLEEMYDLMPWFVYDVVNSVSTRLENGIDNATLKAVLKNIYSKKFEQELENYNPECEEINQDDFAISNIFKMDIAKTLKYKVSKGAFSLDEEIAEECLPWDDFLNKQPVPIGMGVASKKFKEKFNKIRHIKTKLVNLEAEEKNLQNVQASLEKENTLFATDALIIMHVITSFAKAC